jgi:murein DD-endopeptidase MepM/ murein hydrolase activator NlpD
VISLGDGEVVNIQNEHNVSGVNVKNLFSWNSIMIKISLADKENVSENGNRFVYVEYVHIKKDSFTVKVGDYIKKGQIICESGDVGFCPEPHLHLQVHNTDSTDSPTINFFLLDSDNNPFIPKCGNYYP